MAAIALNLIWLAIAVAGIAALGRIASRAPSASLRLIALGCALVLLFPIISASDDAYPTEYRADEAFSTHKLSRVLDSAAHANAHLLYIVFAMPHVIVGAPSKIIGLVSPLPKAPLSTASARPVADRAPPLAFA